MESKAYEIGYLLSPLVLEEAILAMVDELVRTPVEKAGGTVTGTTPPKRQALAYQIGKAINHKRTNYREAYFGAVRFDAAPETLAAIKKDLDLAENILRYIMINLPRRAELPAAKRPLGARRAKAPTADKTVKGAKPEITKEEIDKEIEGLLTQTA